MSSKTTSTSTVLLTTLVASLAIQAGYYLCCVMSLAL
jgi:hypothetical protein